MEAIIYGRSDVTSHDSIATQAAEKENHFFGSGRDWAKLANVQGMHEPNV